MKNLNVKKMVIPGVYLAAVLAVNGLIDNNIIPVQGDENKDNQTSTNSTDKETIIRPYKAEGVSVGRYFYDFEGEATNQENAIVYYENTYMQNSGVDYKSETVFDVISVLNGKVLSVESDEILGNIVKIEHDKEIVSVYQGIDKVTLKVGDNVTQGQVIGTSGTSSINSNYTTSLHFEVYYKGTLMDPENLYTRNLKDL